MMAKAEAAGGLLRAAAAHYDKALSLIDRCGGKIHQLCPAIAPAEADALRAIAARTHLSAGHYARAAELYARAAPRKEEGAAQWGSAAFFGAEDFDAARKFYRSASKTPNRYDGEGALEVLLRSAFAKLSASAEADNRLWDVYVHEQNIARIEALGDIQQRPLPETTEKLISLRGKLSKQGGEIKNGRRWIAPAVSLYAARHAQKGHDHARRGKYHLARREYRMALATDPAWYEAFDRLSQVELQLIGLCDAVTTADLAWKRVRQVPHPQMLLPAQAGMLWTRAGKWKALKSQAERGAATYQPGYCDPDQDLPTRSIIRPDHEVLVAPR